MTTRRPDYSPPPAGAPAAAPKLDPDLLDRRRAPLPVVNERELPIRPMGIAGLEGRMEARILSRDRSGPVTRLARIPSGFGSGAAGAFTADLELFVVKGGLVLGGGEVGENDYAAARAGQVISGLRAVADTLALVMTSAPVRYDSSVGGGLSAPLLGRAGAYRWEEDENMPGWFVMPLAEGLSGRVWLSGWKEWGNGGGRWRSCGSPEEMFVLDGSLLLTEIPFPDSPDSGAAAPPDPARAETRRLGSGSYSFRMPRQFHAGPGSGAAAALAFHRSLGPDRGGWSNLPV